jgi:hypothetical protein
VKRRKWIKVHESWWTTPNHASVKSDTLGFGIHLMMLADSDPDWRETGSARLLNGRKRPLSLAELSSICRVDPRKCKRMLIELIECGTVDLCEETGCYIFPNYREYQEDSSAKRHRKRRDIHVNVPVNVTGEEEGEEEGEQKKNYVYVDGSAPSAQNPSTNTQVGIPGIPTEEQAQQANRREMAVHVAREICQARQRAGIKSTMPKVTEAMVAAVDRPVKNCGATREDWSTVIRRQEVSCQGDKDKARRFLTWNTLSVPANFSRLMSWEHLDGKRVRRDDWL